MIQTIQGFYLWGACLVGLTGLFLGFCSLFLIWRAIAEWKINAVEFRLSHKLLNKKVDMLLKVAGITANSAIPPPHDILTVKIDQPVQVQIKETNNK